MPLRAEPIDVPDTTVGQLELEGALAEEKSGKSSYPSAAAARVWDVIVGLPAVARNSTLRRLGSDDRLLAMVDGMRGNRSWRPNKDWHAAVREVADRVEDRIIDRKIFLLDTEDAAQRIAQMLGWRIT